MAIQSKFKLTSFFLFKYIVQIFLNWKKIDNWVVGYTLNVITSKISTKRRKKLTRVFLCICDHFEPLWGGASYDVGLRRIKKWTEMLPEIAKKYTDKNNNCPQYTFFYPIEEYRQEYLELLADLCRRGYAEVEVHLHHDNDTSDNLRKNLLDFKKTLALKHGLLARDKKKDGIYYGFIHGNWALDNSHPGQQWCGVNNELDILQETGCYADFTMPSAPHPTQTKKINSIYYAIDDPVKPKSHNKGINVQKGINDRKGLLMVQGPLSICFELLTPKIENGCLAYDYQVNIKRIKCWINANIHILNKPEFIFIKLYSHGCQEKTTDYLLGKGLNYLFSYFEQYYNDGTNYLTHFVSARQMVNVIKAVEEHTASDDLEVLKDYKFIKI